MTLWVRMMECAAVWIVKGRRAPACRQAGLP